MSTWPALLLAPSLVLLDVSLAHALATPSCATQREALIGLVLLGSLALTVAFTALAWSGLRRIASHRDPAGHAPSHDSAERQAFTARLAVGLGALSSLAIVAISIPAWVLSPCLA
jgi:hypothetical protein